LEELHKNKILFRDLKAANVLLSADGHVRVTDFGLAKNSEIAYSFLGSFAYLAPEMLSENKVHSFEIDWYLLGVFIYEMLVGLPPFYNTNQTLMFRDIRTAEPRLPEYISK
jgi:serine/threonine protein kinase